MIAKYQLDIERQRESLARYWKEFEEIQDVADLLQQQETKLDGIQNLLNKKLLPQIWNVPHSRNNNFTGREDILSHLRGALTSGENAAWKQTLAGLGGVGKSQLAVEYIYRHLADYKLVWWIRSEDATSLAGDYASIARDLNLPEKDSKDQPEIVRAVKRWLESSEGGLLVFDYATGPEEICNYIPQGGAGHVIITSRNPNWRNVSKVLPVKVFKRPESIDFLCKRTGKDDIKTAGILQMSLVICPLLLSRQALISKQPELP